MAQIQQQMARVNLLIAIFIFFAAANSWACLAQNNDPIAWAKRVETGTEVITTLQFYFHDILSGQNPTAMRIAEAPQTNNSSTFFGMLTMIDDPLTMGPDPTSKVVGRARGMYGSAGQADFGLIMVLNYGFTDGIYDGSSFSLLSINRAMESVREMSIVGGTGLFRFARGYAIAQTYKLDAMTGDAVVGYNVTIATYI
ncbi:dirigent protein 23-like isoform X1 [Primulina huaijiensis]|uniref:dirigent protein 23-like isoform X1 n=2 Tax=Primulina huaijiensis TaxID=1492673 RepID=UPI003CC7475E